MTPRAWYSFQNKAGEPTTVELSIFGSIGTSWWDDNAVSAKQFLEDLNGLAPTVSKIVVRVNSLGGDVFDGVAIANSLRDQALNKGRTVETVVDGIAASAASIVIMAGSVIKVADTGIIMVHNAWTIEIGNAMQMRKTADALDKIRDASIVPAYQWHSQLSAEDLIALMDAETYMDADEAIANGFATEKVAGLKAAASIDSRAAVKLTVPEKYRDRIGALVAPKAASDPKPIPATAAEILAECPSMEVGRELLAAGATLEQVTARVTADRERAESDAAAAREASEQAQAASTRASARANEIGALCTAARLPELTGTLVASGMSADDTRKHLAVLIAKMDQVGIDGALPVDSNVRGRAAISAADIYEARNRRTA